MYSFSIKPPFGFTSDLYRFYAVTLLPLHRYIVPPIGCSIVNIINIFYLFRADDFADLDQRHDIGIFRNVAPKRHHMRHECRVKSFYGIKHHSRGHQILRLSIRWPGIHPALDRDFFQRTPKKFFSKRDMDGKIIIHIKPGAFSIRIHVIDGDHFFSFNYPFSSAVEEVLMLFGSFVAIE